MKLCSLCKVTKHTKDFYSTATRLSSRCKQCYAEVAKAKSKEQKKDEYLRWYFGISLVEYNTLSKDATNCKICLKSFGPNSEKQLDHNHKTKKIRGFLCHKCNKALGLFNDDLGTLTRAIEYLQETD